MTYGGGCLSRTRNGKRGCCRASAAWLLVLLAAPALGAVADQQQLLVDSVAPAFRIGGFTGQELAQVMATGVAGSLVAVRLPVSCTSGSLILEIQSVVGGIPGGVTLAAETFPASSLPPSFAGESFPTLSFFAPATFDAGERFAVVLRSSGTCSVAAGPLGNPYPPGSAYFRDQDTTLDSWSSLGPRDDLPFQTLVDLSGANGGGPATEEDGVTGFLILRCFVDSLGY